MTRYIYIYDKILVIRGYIMNAILFQIGAVMSILQNIFKFISDFLLIFVFIGLIKYLKKRS